MLSDDEVLLLKPICRALDLPLQPPVSINLFKKVMVTEKPTGRVIEYRNDVKCNSFVTLNKNRDGLNSEPRFGQIQSLFSYRNNNFAVIKKFECPTDNVSGLVCITNCTIHSKAIYLLEELSRPLVVAINESADQKIWILNA